MLLQVEFYDPLGLPELSAIHADEGSKYVAERTAFRGFAGEVRAELLRESVRCLAPIVAILDCVLTQALCTWSKLRR